MQVVEKRPPLLAVSAIGAQKPDHFLLKVCNRDELVLHGLRESTAPYFDGLGFNPPVEVGIAQGALIRSAPARCVQFRIGVRI